jgi:hypothetical protein
MESPRNMVSREREDRVEVDRGELPPIGADGGDVGFRAVLLLGLNFRWVWLGTAGAFFDRVVLAGVWALAVEAKAPATTAVATRSFRACMIRHHPENRRIPPWGRPSCRHGPRDASIDACKASPIIEHRRVDVKIWEVRVATIPWER